MKTTTTTEQSNDLRYSVTKTKGGLDYIIKIRLNDECKNGHQDFSITGDVYTAGKRGDGNCQGGGAMGDTIAKLFPEFAIFDRLHLCTAKGVPMYAIENGFYWLKEKGVTAAADYLRLTPEQAKQIEGAEDKIYLQCILEKMGVPAQWEAEANEAIKLLEDWTGKEFINDSKKAGFIPLGEKIKEVEQKIKSGYYTPEKIADREEEKQRAKITKKLEDLKTQRDKEIDKANIEYNAKAEILRAGGLMMEDNAIYYNHSNEVRFNWMSYGPRVTQEQLDAFIKVVDKSQFPAGVTFGFAKK